LFAPIEAFQLIVGVSVEIVVPGLDELPGEFNVGAAGCANTLQTVKQATTKCNKTILHVA
jgi:hypothetical protein